MSQQVHTTRVSELSFTRPRSPYWIDAGLEIRVRGPEGEREITLDKPFARIGTHPAAEIRLRASELAVRDVYLHATAEGLYCCPITSIEHAVAPPHRWLSPDETFALGPYELSARVRNCEAAASPSAIRLDEKDHSLSVRPVAAVLFDGRHLTRRTLRRRLTIVGRRWPSSLRVGSPALSTCHLALYWDGSDLWAVDLLSRVGTWIEGDAFDVVKMALGTHLRIGEIEIAYVGVSRSGGSSNEPADDDPMRPLEMISPWADDEADVASDIATVDKPPAAGPSPIDHAAELEALPAVTLAQQAQWLAERDVAERQLAEQRAALEAEHAAVQAERAQGLAQHDEAERQLAEQRAALEADRAAVDVQQAQWLAERNTAERQLAERRAAIEDRHAALEADQADLSTRRAAMDAELSSLEAQREAMASREQSQALWDEQRREWEATTQQRHAHLDAESARVAELRDELSARERDLSRQQSDLQAAITEFQQHRATWEAHRDRPQERGEDLELMTEETRETARPAVAPATPRQPSDGVEAFETLSRRLLVVTRSRSGWRARLRALFKGGRP